MPATTRRGAVIAALATTALAAPATAAAAPTLGTDRGCYTAGMPIGISGSGYTPDGPVDMELGLGESVYSYSGAAGPAGELGGAIELPDFPGSAQLQASLVTADLAQVPPGGQPGPDQMASTTFTASPWYMAVPGWGDGRTVGVARPGKRTKLEAVGFVGTASSTLYAHYIRRGKVKTSRIGTLTGPCGDLVKKFKQFPFKTRKGLYKVVFDTTRAYPNDDVGIVYPRVRVRKGAQSSIRLLQTASTDRVTGRR